MGLPRAQRRPNIQAAKYPEMHVNLQPPPHPTPLSRFSSANALKWEIFVLKHAIAGNDRLATNSELAKS